MDAQLYLIEDWEEFGHIVLKASYKNKGQLIVHEIGEIGEVFSELEKEAERNDVPDFKKRTKGTPLQVT